MLKGYLQSHKTQIKFHQKIRKKKKKTSMGKPFLKIKIIYKSFSAIPSSQTQKEKKKIFFFLLVDENYFNLLRQG